MKKTILLFGCLLLLFSVIIHAQDKQSDGIADRKLWLRYMDKIAWPVMSNLAADQLKRKNADVSF